MFNNFQQSNEDLALNFSCGNEDEFDERQNSFEFKNVSLAVSATKEFNKRFSRNIFIFVSLFQTVPSSSENFISR